MYYKLRKVKEMKMYFGIPKNRKNEEFTIIRSEIYAIGKFNTVYEIVLAQADTNQGSVYVTWECKDGKDYFWGHYFSNKYRALEDYHQRLYEYYNTLAEESEDER